MCMRDAPPDWLRALAHFFETQGWPLYAVGGWVRDRLMELPARDVDLCGPASPEVVLEGLRGRSGVWAVPAAPALGTLVVGVEYDGERRQAEYTAFRRESYGRGGGHRPRSVALGATLGEDALRRDFTVNALYMELPSGRVADPLSGLSDIENKTIRATRTPLEVFDDDGLRLLRLVRTACELDFAIDPAAWDAACRRAGHLRDIAPERVGDEMERILLSDARYPGRRYAVRPVERALRMLREMGALEIALPEAADCSALDRRIRGCAMAPPELRLRLAALLGGAGPLRAAAALERLRRSRRLTDAVARLVEYNGYDAEDRLPPEEIRRFFARMGYAFARDLIEIRRADRRAANGGPDDPAARWAAVLDRMERERSPESPDGIALTGRDIAGLLGEPPSPRVGRAKRALWRHVIDHPEANTRDELIREFRRMMDEPARWDTQDQ